MSDFREHLERSLQDPEFKAEWDAQVPERALMRQGVEDAPKSTEENNEPEELQ